MKTPLSLICKCCSFTIKIGLTIFSLQWHFNSLLCKNVENLDDNVLGPLDICLGFLEVSSEFAFSPIMIQLIQ